MQKIILIIALILVGASISLLVAQNFVAQPYYQDGKIRIYNNSGTITPASPAYTLDLATDMQNAFGVSPSGSAGPNAIITHNNKLFVSFDIGLYAGGVLVYDYSMLFPNRNTAVQPTVIKFGGGTGNPCAGMAIQPSTGDLYVATFHGGSNGGDGGVYKVTAASGYTQAGVSQFSSYNNDPTVAYYAANLAFDGNNNLWLTTWDGTATANTMYLICYRNMNKNAYYKIVNQATKAYTATSTSGVTRNVHLLSAPEGMAFDATGNLWLGNNNDFNAVNAAGEGTLAKISGNWIAGILFNSSPGNTYTVPTNQATVYYIPSGKLGGMAISGNTIYINDQGQNQGNSYTTNGTVWKYDVTTTFNATNFKASGIKTTYPGNGQMTFFNSLTAPTPSTKVFVKSDATGANNGTSWANAYVNLQDALNAGGVDTFFVAAGTYKPSTYPHNCTNCTNGNYRAFMLADNQKVFGSFAGTEKWLTQRSAITTPTSILSGDYGVIGDNSDNTFRVMLLIGVQNAQVDGFSIEGGNARNGCATMDLSNGESINCGIGAAVYTDGANLTFSNCHFKNNAAVRCNNGLGGKGGAIYAYNSTTTFEKCKFSNNSATGSGGAIFHEAQAVPYIYNCIFENNYAEGSGGALYFDYSNGIVRNSVFSGNNTTNGGGAVGLNLDYGTFENCVFYNNYVNTTATGSGHGGAMYIYDGDGLDIRNCTFYNNHADKATSIGGAIYESAVQNNASSNIYNCIFWNNNTPNNATDETREELWSDNFGSTPQTILSNNLIRTDGSIVNYIDGNNNILGNNANPVFINAASPIGADNKWATADDGLMLTCIVSPALNRSINAPTNDIRGVVRQGNADIGAYESQCAATTNAVYQSNSSACQSITVNNVTGNNWFHFSNANGIAASINPNGMNMGNVTVSVADPTSVINVNANKFLSRMTNFTSSMGNNFAGNYTMRIYFKDTEITDFQAATGQTGLTPNSFNVAYASGGTSCNGSGFTGTTGGVLAAGQQVVTGEYGLSNEGFYLQFDLNHFTIFGATTNSNNNVLVSTENQENMIGNIIMFPNPTDDKLNLMFETTLDQTTEVIITDVLGRQVKSFIINKNETQFAIPLNDCTNGIYTITILQNNIIQKSQRIVKQ